MVRRLQALTDVSYVLVGPDATLKGHNGWKVSQLYAFVFNFSSNFVSIPIINTLVQLYFCNNEVKAIIWLDNGKSTPNGDKPFKSYYSRISVRGRNGFHMVSESSQVGQEG